VKSFSRSIKIFLVAGCLLRYIKTIPQMNLWESQLADIGSFIEKVNLLLLEGNASDATGLGRPG
jgi:hypothetical protein